VTFLPTNAQNSSDVPDRLLGRSKAGFAYRAQERNLDLRR